MDKINKELLEALKLYVSRAEENASVVNRDVWYNAKNAIAKAEGKTNG